MYEHHIHLWIWVPPPPRWVEIIQKITNFRLNLQGLLLSMKLFILEVIYPKWPTKVRQNSSCVPQLAQSNFSSYVSVWHSQWDDHIPTHHTICSYHVHTHHMILLVAQGNEEVKKAPCIACPVGRNFCSNTCLWEKYTKSESLW